MVLERGSEERETMVFFFPLFSTQQPFIYSALNVCVSVLSFSFFFFSFIFFLFCRVLLNFFFIFPVFVFFLIILFRFCPFSPRGCLVLLFF